MNENKNEELHVTSEIQIISDDAENALDSVVKEEVKVEEDPKTIPVVDQNEVYNEEEPSFEPIPEVESASELNDMPKTPDMSQDGVAKESEVNNLPEDETKKKSILPLLMILLVAIATICFFLFVLPNITEKDPLPETPNTQTGENEDPSTNRTEITISDEWVSGEFILDGHAYKLFDNIKSFEDNGWQADYVSAGFANGHKLEVDERLEAPVSLKHSKYPDAKVQVYFVNSASNEPQDIKNSSIYKITIDNTGLENKVDYELPKKLKTGASSIELDSLYKLPEETNIIRDDINLITTYKYISDIGLTLELTIHDNDGLIKFSYSM